MPFRFDYSPLAELVALYEITICILVTTVIIVITMLICGVLMHTTAQLGHLKGMILEMSSVTDRDVLEGRMRLCVKYHTAIVE
jgi:hypothetical protein